MRRVVVVTGGTAGVGRATARAFAKSGYDVAVLARGEERLADTERELRDTFGVRALGVSVDVSDSEAVDAAADRIERELGPISVWVNNAMASVFAPVHEVQAKEYKRVTEVTYLGYVHGTLAALRHMRTRDRGTIVQVGSALAYRAIPLQSAYCASKFAVRGFTDSLRTELLHDHSRIKLTMVQLPAMNTPQFDWSRNHTGHRTQPVPPIFEPEVAAKAILRAAERPRREVYVGYPTVKAIVGTQLAPWLADRYLARKGYDAQQTPQTQSPDAPDNLWEPVPGHQAARGRFSDRSKDHSTEWWIAWHRRSIAAGALGATLAVVVARRAHKTAS